MYDLIVPRSPNYIELGFVGFAFILMEDARDAEDAVKELDGSRVCGRRIKVGSRMCCLRVVGGHVPTNK